ncbi:MAG: LacI family DNA-binding transcriptional regulator [Pseudomonadota bacterium]
MKSRSSKRGYVSLTEVAEAAGVSKMTASRVLRNANGFSEETRNKVMREVERLGYVPDRIAAAFGSEQTSTIVGVSVPYLSSSIFGAVLDSMNGALAKFGYQTMIGAHENSPETEETWIKNILSWRPAGLILSGHSHTGATRELLKAQGIPVVEIWNLNTSPIDMSVGFNHYDCGHEMGEFVLSKGHTNIGYVGADAQAPGLGALRRKGFASALKSAGLQFASEEILIDRSGFYAGYYGTENILNRVGSLDAIYYQDDVMAIGGFFYCQSRGMRIPDDIGIAGWGSMEAASVLPQRLTTTVVSTQALGKSAADTLIARIRGEPQEDMVITPTRLAPGGTV